MGEVRAWCDEVTNSSLQDSRKIEDRVTEYRAAVNNANLPFLGLSVGTPIDVAIDVFIKLNTSAVRLSAFDIIVAQFEDKTGQSLHDLEESLRASVPDAESYLPIQDWVLRVAALREGRESVNSSFMRLDMHRLSDEWKAIEAGISGTVGFLHEEKIFDRERLPTITPLPVIASIWSQMPQALDEHGEARAILRKYLWRSFFTERYDRAANSGALQDHRGLVARIVHGDKSASIRSSATTSSQSQK